VVAVSLDLNIQRKAPLMEAKESPPAPASRGLVERQLGDLAL
jgi:hypothetical protein